MCGRWATRTRCAIWPLAEEVEKVNPDLVVRDKEGKHTASVMTL